MGFAVVRHGPVPWTHRVAIDTLGLHVAENPTPRIPPLLPAVAAAVGAAISLFAGAEQAWGPTASAISSAVAALTSWLIAGELQTALGAVSQGQKQLRETSAELKALQGQPAGDPAELERLRGELESAKKAARDAESDARTAKDQASKLEAELAASKAAADAARAEAATAKEEASRHAQALRVKQAATATVDNDEPAPAELAPDEVVAPQPASIAASAFAPEAIDGLERQLGDALGNLDETRSAMDNIDQGLKGISESVELLASNAEESSSSILEMAAANDEVAESMFNLAASVQQTATSIEEMTFSVKEVAKNIEALSSTAEETSSAMNEMDISIQQVENNANETAQLSEEVVWAAEGGVDAINQTIEVINMIKLSSADAVSVIASLGGRIEEIGKILSVIDDVSEQTNLLALNAAIIAAQAGEHGKGFAVVADEIKDLAERSATSTKEIAEIIKSVQRESRNAVLVVQRSSKSVDDGVRVSHQAEDALKRISDAARRATQMVREIARATVEQTKGSKQVTDAINVVATTVQQVATATAEQARGAEQIMRSAEKMKAITRHVERSTQEQTRGSRQITRAIESISEMVNQLHDAHRTQMDSVRIAIERLSQLENTTAAQRQQLNILREAVSS